MAIKKAARASAREIGRRPNAVANVKYNHPDPWHLLAILGSPCLSSDLIVGTVMRIGAADQAHGGHQRNNETPSRAHLIQTTADTSAMTNNNPPPKSSSSEDQHSCSFSPFNETMSARQ
jgi:hypothetical protein